jgi:hypothetical protein
MGDDRIFPSGIDDFSRQTTFIIDLAVEFNSFTNQISSQVRNCIDYSQNLPFLCFQSPKQDTDSTKIERF